VIACKDWHDVPTGPAAWRRVLTFEGGKYPDPFVIRLTTSCYHCAEPACLDVCPAEAIYKREKDGIVLVDQEECLGKDQCGQCLEVCPYEAPQFIGKEENPKMQKCNFCLDRWQEGKLPICVGACPTRALDAGPIQEMEVKYGTKIHEAVGFTYNEELQPSILFKPKRFEGRPTKIVAVPFS